MSVYERHVLPRLIDIGCGVPPVRALRAELVHRARGRVLEVGIGTGLNMAYYDLSRIDRVVGVDPGWHPLARKRAARAGVEVELMPLSAETIPVEDASFDSVLMTFTLCSIPAPLSAVREMRRVLKDGGELIFCEHGRAPDDKVRRWQDRVTPLWRKLFGGCHLNREIPALLEEGGFDITSLKETYLSRPHTIAYVYRGSAQAA